MTLPKRQPGLDQLARLRWAGWWSDGGLKPVLANTGWLVAEKLLRIILALFVGAWVARYLGPDRFGVLTYVLTVVGFFQAAALLGLDSIMVKELAVGSHNAGRIFGTAVGLRLMAGLASWCALMMFIVMARPAQPQVFWMVGLAGIVIFLQAAETIDLWFQSQMASRRTVLVKTVVYLLAALVRVVLILTDAELIWFVAVVPLEALLFGAGMWVMFQKHPLPQRLGWDAKQARKLMEVSLPFWVSALSVFVYMQIDKLMLSAFVSDYDLGMYSAVLPLSTALYFAPVVLCQSLAPQIAQLKAVDDGQYRRTLSLLMCVMWWGSIAGASVIAWLAPQLIGLLLGSTYMGSTTLLQVHVFCLIPVSLGVASSLWLVNENMGKWGLIRTLVGVVVNVAANLVLLPMLGALGAAISALSAQLCAALVMTRIFSKELFEMKLKALFFRFA